MYLAALERYWVDLAANRANQTNVWSRLLTGQREHLYTRQKRIMGRLLSVVITPMPWTQLTFMLAFRLDHCPETKQNETSSNNGGVMPQCLDPGSIVL